MSLFDWNSSYELGVPDSDNQHKKLVNLINDVADAHHNGGDTDRIGDILEDLVFYTKLHFNNEEQFMEKNNYPELVEHRKIHQSFTEQIIKFKDEYKQGKSRIDAPLLEFLKNWLVNHILIEDKKYGILYGHNH